jgi:hypothetical protein
MAALSKRFEEALVDELDLVVTELERLTAPAADSGGLDL